MKKTSANQLPVAIYLSSLIISRTAYCTHHFDNTRIAQEKRSLKETCATIPINSWVRMQVGFQFAIKNVILRKLKQLRTVGCTPQLANQFSVWHLNYRSCLQATYDSLHRKWQLGGTNKEKVVIRLSNICTYFRMFLLNLPCAFRCSVLYISNVCKLIKYNVKTSLLRMLREDVMST